MKLIDRIVPSRRWRAQEAARVEGLRRWSEDLRGPGLMGDPFNSPDLYVLGCQVDLSQQTGYTRDQLREYYVELNRRLALDYPGRELRATILQINVLRADRLLGDPFITQYLEPVQREGKNQLRLLRANISLDGDLLKLELAHPDLVEEFKFWVPGHPEVTSNPNQGVWYNSYDYMT